MLASWSLQKPRVAWKFAIVVSCASRGFCSTQSRENGSVSGWVKTTKAWTSTLKSWHGSVWLLYVLFRLVETLYGAIQYPWYCSRGYFVAHEGYTSSRLIWHAPDVVQRHENVYIHWWKVAWDNTDQFVDAKYHFQIYRYLFKSGNFLNTPRTNHSLYIFLSEKMTVYQA